MYFDHKIECNTILIYLVCTVSANRAGSIEHNKYTIQERSMKDIIC